MCNSRHHALGRPPCWKRALVLSSNFKAAAVIIVVALCGVGIHQNSQNLNSWRLDDSYHSINFSQQKQKEPEVHLVAVADANFAEKYRPLFEKNQQYADLHNYKWHVIGTESKNCTKMHRDYFFRKHCMIAEWMESSLNKDDVVVVFDSDVVPFRSNISLNNWTTNGEDIVMYERIWNNEIMAGNYIARNNPRARQFLREWSKFEYEMPPNAFSSSDNGKLWQHDTFLLFY